MYFQYIAIINPYFCILKCNSKYEKVNFQTKYDRIGYTSYDNQLTRIFSTSFILKTEHSLQYPFWSLKHGCYLFTTDLKSRGVKSTALTDSQFFTSSYPSIRESPINQKKSSPGFCTFWHKGIVSKYLAPVRLVSLIFNFTLDPNKLLCILLLHKSSIPNTVDHYQGMAKLLNCYRL